MNYGGSYGGGMLDDSRGLYKKKRGFLPRLASFHGILAWLLFVTTLLYSIKSRASMSKELAELKQFSSSTESETFQKISKMNQQIADKNREIGNLNKTQRSNQKTITNLETEKTALQANLQAAKDETTRCTQREASLQTQLHDCNANCEKEIDSHGQAHKSKDAEIEELKRQVQQLVAAQQNPQPVPSPVPSPVTSPIPKSNKNKKKGQQEQQQPTAPSKMDNVRYETEQASTEESDSSQYDQDNVKVFPLPVPKDLPKRRKKRAASKLEQDIGIDAEEDLYKEY